MTARDARGCSLSGASADALAAYEGALDAASNWRGGAEPLLAAALQAAPGFAMAHVLQAWLRVCGRDAQRARSARALLAHAAGLPANERERMHLAAIGAVLDDDYEGAKARLGELLQQYPRDLLALQVAHGFDYVTGDITRMLERVAAVLPAWHGELPGRSAVLAMHAFALEECGEYARAEHGAHAALALDAANARAHHVMAHVFEMTARADAGERWMNEHHSRWADRTPVATHGWWHVALFQLTQRRPERALALFDQRVRAARSSEVADLIDAAALLWRIALCRGGVGIDAGIEGDPLGARWAELADAWAAHIDDAFCSFNDLHAMLAFVGARDWDRARRLEQALAAAQSRATRHGQTTRLLGLPAGRALLAFGRGNDRLAIILLAGLPAHSQRLGGSHAQRDVLQLTLRHAIERARRSQRARTIAAWPGMAPLPALSG